MMKHHLLALSFSSVFAACVVGEPVGGAPSAGRGLPSAPSQLTARAASTGGVHLTWTDTSGDELHFMVMRAEQAHVGHGGPGGDGHALEHEEIATLPPNTSAYHDPDTESGMSYVYIVAVMNAAGERESNEVTIEAP